MSDKTKLDRQVELQNLYLRNMAKIKWRVQAIQDILNNTKSTTYKITNTEFCVLQIRKILELIALSALVSDADVYRNALGKIENMWNARCIIRDIERIHPGFYPEPIEVVYNKNEEAVDEWVQVQRPFLDKEQFVNIYNRCGKYLHEPSPFKTEEEIAASYASIEQAIPNWISLIVALLSTHVVHLYNQSDLFFITMGGKGSLPHGNIFSQIQN